jgi:D-alanine-D-alanine ligase
MKVVLLHTQEALEPPVDPVIEQVSGALESLGHETSTLAVGSTVAPLVSALESTAPDLVFNLCESFGGRSALESSVAGLLNLLGLRYTGSSPAGLLLAGDKALTKQMLSFHGIPTPEFASMYRGALDWSGDLQFPLIVKPPQEDASLGITSKSVVHDVKELLQRMDELQSTYQSPILVERYIEGREFYVGVLGNATPVALPLIEMDFTGFPEGRPRIASWDAKWGEDGGGSGEEYAGTRSVLATDVPEELVTLAQETAVNAYRALRLRDYARIDLRVAEDGMVHVIEVNPNCYLEREAEFSRAAAESGLEYGALIERIAELATARYSR